MTPLPDMGRSNSSRSHSVWARSPFRSSFSLLRRRAFIVTTSSRRTIAAGADPIAAACALRPRDTTCSLAAASRR